MPPKSVAKVSTAPNRKPLRAINAEYVSSLLAYAEILYKGGLGPKDVKRPETVAALIEIGRDVGLPATMAIRWIAIINGAPSIWGDAAMALIRSSGLLDPAYPKEKYEGEPGDDDFAAVFAVKRIGGAERVSRFSVADAKQANLWGKKGPWTDYQERMLMWRAKGFACRDEFQDVLCGLVFAEEALDYPQQDRVTVIETKETEPTIKGIVETLKNSPKGTSYQVGVGFLPPPPGVFEPEPITGEQMDRLIDLRESLCVAKNCRTDEEKDTAWKEALATMANTDSALKLSRQEATEFISRLEKVHDPFPPASPTQAT